MAIEHHRDASQIAAEPSPQADAIATLIDGIGYADLALKSRRSHQTYCENAIQQASEAAMITPLS